MSKPKHKKSSPFAGDSSGVFLPWMVMVMVFLAALMLSLNFALHRGLKDWYKDMSSEITVQIMPSAKKAQTVEKVMDILEKSEEFMKIHKLSEAEIAKLLEPYMGKSQTLDAQIVPDLIVLEPKQGITFKSLQKIENEFKDVKVGTQKEWLMHMKSFITSLEKLARLILVLVFLSMIFIVIYAVKTSLRVHAKAINLLHLIGAKDSYIARKFAKRNMWLALVGSCLGAAMAIPFVHVTRLIIEKLQEGILKNIKFTYEDDIVILGLALATSFFVYVMTYITVKQDLLRRT